MPIQKIFLPTKVDIIGGKEDKNHAVITIEPLHPGYGLTIGNALRRVLLSSLPGAAVIAFKIKGVQHEFSTITGIREDIVEIMMNLKQLRLKVFSEEPVELAINTKGEKVVKASDIGKNADVEIVNPDLVICHLTEKSTVLEMKIWVEQGLGYVPVEERKGEKSEIGVIQVDAVYTPIKKVGFKTENMRVGERTDYDRLILDIETDGTITPGDALKQVAKILVEQFSFIVGEGKAVGGEGLEGNGEPGAGSKREDGGVKTKAGDEEIEEEPVSIEEIATKGSKVGLKPEEIKEGKPKKKRGRPKKTESE